MKIPKFMIVVYTYILQIVDRVLVGCVETKNIGIIDNVKRQFVITCWNDGGLVGQKFLYDETSARLWYEDRVYSDLYDKVELHCITKECWERSETRPLNKGAW